MAASKFATFSDLISKPRRTKTVSVGNGSGKLTVKIQAIGSTEYDALIESHQPTAAQKKKNNVYNTETFAPALIAACVIEPNLSLEEAKELYHSSTWASGEIGGLFIDCMKLCNEGLDIPFTVED